MNHFHEIERMSQSANPNLAIVTKIGTSHIGILGSRENIARAKSEIVGGMCAAGDLLPLLVLGGEDDFTPFIRDTFAAPAGVDVMLAGVSDDDEVRACDIRIDDEGRPVFTLDFGLGETIDTLLAIPGAQSVPNAVKAAAVAYRLGVTPEQIDAAFRGLTITGHRQEIKRAKSGARVIDDSYNASAESMAAGLDLLCSLSCTGSRMAVLGEMGEMGDEAPRMHELVGAYAVAELPRVELISKMIGKELGDIQSMGKNTALCGDEVLIEADGLSAFGRIQDFDLQIHRGEVVGFAGLLGSGRTETAELLAGVAKPEQGALRMNGREVHFNSPLDAMHHKIAFCPEDRKIQGIIGDLSVRENIIIGLQAKKGMWNHIPLKEQERIADEYIKLLQIKVSSPEQLIRNLSGGNQQKAIIAREIDKDLSTKAKIVLLSDPTRGIDIGTKTEIQKMVIQLAREQHMSIIFISSEIDEMTRTCTRLAVLRDRRKVAELTGDDINSDRVMAAIAGGA